MCKNVKKKCFSKTLQLGNFLESTDSAGYVVVTPAILSGIYQFEATGTANSLVLDEEGQPCLVPIILNDNWLLKIFKMAEVSTDELIEAKIQDFNLFLSKNQRYGIAKLGEDWRVFFVRKETKGLTIDIAEMKPIMYVHELQNFHSSFTGEYIDSSTIKKKKIEKFYQETDFSLVPEVDLYDVYDFKSLFTLLKE